MTVRIEFPAPAPLLNLNDRMHWRKKATRMRAWRDAAKAGAVKAKVGPQWPSVVSVSLPVRAPGARRDPHNFVLTVKPIIDGLVDAGLWPDDHSGYVATVEPRFHKAVPGGWTNTIGLVVVELKPMLATAG